MDSSPSGGKRKKSALGSPGEPGERHYRGHGTLDGSVQGVEGSLTLSTFQPPETLRRGLFNPVCFCFFEKADIFF